jgi:hypothetical protein
MRADIATDKLLKSIKIEGVTASGAAVYDLTLADVALTQLHDGSGGSDALSFAYQRLGLITPQSALNCCTRSCRVPARSPFW